MTDQVAVGSAEPAVLSLHSADGRPVPELDDHVHRCVRFADGADLDTRVAQAAVAVERFGAPMHVIASGPDGAVAVRLAVSRPDLVASLVLADASARSHLGDVTAQLPEVTVPALVVAACPDGENGVEESQTLAGQIPDGVFVVIDHVEPPAHMSRRASFTAWASSFISIVDGLRDRQAVLGG